MTRRVYQPGPPVGTPENDAAVARLRAEATSTKTWRCYEAHRNAGGGLDGAGCDNEYVTAASAQDAADEYAETLRDAYLSSGDDDLDGIVVIATDDDGDSAESEVSR